MVARPGKIQATFSAGWIAPSFAARTEQKAYNGGLRQAWNVEIIPQGGFRVAPRSVTVGELPDTAARLMPFSNSKGIHFEIALHSAGATVWSALAKVATLELPYSPLTLPEIDWTQQLDTAIVFHPDIRPRRIKCAGTTSWSVDLAPIANIANYDFGATYTNGTPSVWEIQLIGFKATATQDVDEIVFRLTVSRQTTPALHVVWDPVGAHVDHGATANQIRLAILGIPGVKPGVTVDVVSALRFAITFEGAGNEGDGWAVSGEVLNKADAAVAAYHTTIGVAPGEPFISNDRGWPSTGLFYSQRLIMGGFRSLPNAWAYSIEGDYYNFDQRIDEANGSALVPMNADGGERILHFFSGRNLCVFTNKAEYWIAERAISKTAAPNHVQSSQHGSRAGVPVVENEGAALFVHASGTVVGEFNYTDVTGSFRSIDMTIFASHLMVDLVDQARQRSSSDGDGNRHFLVRGDGTGVYGTLLREQEITAYTRWTTDGAIKAATVNGRNQVAMIVERTVGTETRRTLERLSSAALLDCAVVVAPTSEVVGGLGALEGATVWAIGDGDVYGPFVVADAKITLSKHCASVTVGRWSPPLVETLPPGRLVGGDIWVQRRARIHSVQVLVEDTTSIAIGANGGRTYDVDLRRYGQAADVAELDAGYTGWLKIRGLTGFSDEPTVIITQHRPGRLMVKAIILETNLGN